MTHKWEVCKHAAQWPEGSKASEATGSGWKTVVLMNPEIQTLGEKIEGLGAQWGTKPNSC